MHYILALILGIHMEALIVSMEEKKPHPFGNSLANYDIMKLG